MKKNPLAVAGMLFVLIAAGYALFLRVGPSMSYVNFLLPTMLLLGVWAGAPPRSTCCAPA